MKLRIQDSSVRFRITIKELEQLAKIGVVARETRVPASGGHTVFLYQVRRAPDADASDLQVTPFAFTLLLSQPDFQELADPSKEGVYIRREWIDQEGKTCRFLVFIEKDRPGSTCLKQEAWIYEINPGGEPTTVPRVARSAGSR